MQYRTRHLAMMFAGIVLMAAAVDALAQSPVEKAERDELTFVPRDDPAMAAAFRKARATLDGFLERLSAPPAQTSDYAVKLRITDRDKVEFFWITDLARDGNGFRGVVANTPRQVRTVREGQTIRFARGDIYDWTYIDAARGRMMGNFTSCALLSREPPAAAAEFRRRYGLICD